MASTDPATKPWNSDTRRLRDFNGIVCERETTRAYGIRRFFPTSHVIAKRVYAIPFRTRINFRSIVGYQPVDCR